MNNINMMRLVLASAVIVGHAPEMIDGNRTREPLAQIAPYASLGSVAVSGFFLLSGYLIVKSMLRENALLPYLRRRIVRIVPGFLAAYLLSFLVLAPLLGLSIRPRLHEAAWNMLFFKAVPVFPELAMPYPSVNGAIWTIAYEFRCYLLVALLWATGLLKMPRFMVSLTALLLTLNIAIGSYQVTSFLDQGRNVRWVDLLFGPMTEEIGFVGTFLLGACFFLYRDRLSPYLTWKTALTSAALALLAFRSEHLQFFARAALLAFPIFWMAFKANVGGAATPQRPLGHQLRHVPIRLANRDNDPVFLQRR